MSQSLRNELSDAVRPLFEPITIGGLELRNRFVMAPMTRHYAPGGIPAEGVAAYYRRRAKGGVALIITEGAFPDHPVAHYDSDCPNFYGEECLNRWRRVVDEVHEAGGRIFVQLWHSGFARKAYRAFNPDEVSVAPSGVLDGRIPIELWDMKYKPGDGLARAARAMTQKDIDQVIESFAKATTVAKEIGFDGVNIHAGHGYLIDSFFWGATNHRKDRYGGDTVARTRFAVEMVEEMRRRVGPSFPLMLRYSQWKNADYKARMFNFPSELEQFLVPLVEAGIDILDASTRRFWEPEFPGSHLNLAGWSKRLTGKPVMTIGSLGLSAEVSSSDVFSEREFPVSDAHIDQLLERFNSHEFDLIGLGRALLANPDWPERIRLGDIHSMKSYKPGLALRSLE